jgi:hypothetical protein
MLKLTYFMLLLLMTKKEMESDYIPQIHQELDIQTNLMTNNLFFY